eukprot:3459534-Amphidinium_carterae.1
MLPRVCFDSMWGHSHTGSRCAHGPSPSASVHPPRDCNGDFRLDVILGPRGPGGEVVHKVPTAATYWVGQYFIATVGNCGHNPAAGKRFADEAMADVLVMRSFADRLAPLPTASRPPASSSGGGATSVSEGASQRKLVRDNAQMKEQLKRLRAEDVKPKAAFTKGKAQPKKSGDPRCQRSSWPKTK